MKKLSIVVPCYNEEEALGLFYPAVKKVVDELKLLTEYWFINDGSSDQTLAKLKKLHQQNPDQVHYLSFSRNFGKEAAMYAGLKAAEGDYVVIMDADLQDPPSFLPKMVALLETGDWDCVGTRRVDRTGEKKYRAWLSEGFYKLINRISDTQIVPNARDFRMMTRKMVNAVLSMKEYSRFSKGIFSWVGFKTKFLEYHNVERVAGETSWSTWQLFKYAFAGIADFSLLPLNIAVWIGSVSFISAVLGIIFVVVRHIINPSLAIVGWASVVCIILLIGGLQLLCIGIIGRYIGKIYLQVKDRPIYIVDEKA
ncbi:bactoprenol glucosyl transferase [Lactobacillus pasteurii DSM 23907 = CRBIP 24.76]|uniref:Group 2 glycosyl transferase n=1 Tax=Lactobacillus pasteurii DSM 23907 = CRBIP 24.76 TaxID=1423790 RepID=I7LEM4_9LACO|nr:glycosyltransferase family 2 protein [Lactobacillus pasteurii]KRK08787.1 bactoprenol glucosyl transferase [Lactobacillus pasteurii DSM 23907 = CRBIP 24.76]TDG76378.1 hypothetical protein C5L33_001137 [Lactobacillus pasteurii]CCI85898.1 Group 2 glycosyl transferase [Lactobacillus pasteurii DSM 23907 = CRBIP 24.76]